ncbi:hypothetical protein EWM64_g658 [Hericium alpestre]|uniref:Uncharacterized protein n=1 Tax=Hericium alpestre TaxID=135208 RepID=A0A4Z0AAK6_9AGAM|nr:hypothetical protein EWM64_g658 [Hericium alpestre]
MVLVACMLFILSTLHVGVGTYRCIVGTIYYRDDMPGGPSMYFGDLKAFPFIFLNVVYMLQTLLGDSMVIYRCYVVWQSFRIIIFPVIMLTATLVTGIGGIWASSILPSGAAIFAKGAANWITSFYSLSMATNIICTSLLVYRIWKTAADVRRHLATSALPLMSVLLVIVDAALLYTFTLLTSLILFAIGSNAQDLIVSMLVPIISITFYMVIMRSGLAKLPSSPRSTAERAAAAAATESRMAFDPSPFIERMTYVTGLDREVDIETGVDTEDDGLDNFEAAPNSSLVKIPRQMHVSPSCSQSDLSR